MIVSYIFLESRREDERSRQLLMLIGRCRVWSLLQHGGNYRGGCSGISSVEVEHFGS